jgi:hypothetical protein
MKQLSELLDLGAWIGRRQAFGLMAGRCSSAEANCLRQIRDAKAYRNYDLTWEQFCTNHLGISRRLADKLIQQLQEFGENYFQLAAITRIPPEQYRLIAADVTSEGLEFRGERIPFDPDRAALLSAAVQELLEKRSIPSPTSSKPVADSLRKADQRISAVIEALERLRSETDETADRLQLQGIIAKCCDRLHLLQLSLEL